MAVLGIVTCEILELEFAHVIGADTRVERISVIENKSSHRFLNALQGAGVNMTQRLRQLADFKSRPEAKVEVLVRVLELTLHNRKSNLQEALIDELSKMSAYANVLLLGYGLCGNALEQPQQLFANIKVPIIIPKDQDHLVDDCVGLIIGGRDCYYQEQCKVAGTFFMTPGWANHWQTMLEIEYGGMALPMMRRLMADYKRSLMLLTSVMTEDSMIKKTAFFNQLFGLRVETRLGTLDILQGAWRNAVSHLLMLC